MTSDLIPPGDPHEPHSLEECTMEQREPYQMKDLGYKRTSAGNMKLRVTFHNGEAWDIPAQLIADDRDENYRSDEEDTIGMCLEDDDYYELTDWASNNMNWSDVSDYAVLAHNAPAPDCSLEWLNGKKEIVR